MSYRIQGWLIQNPRSCEQGSSFFPSVPLGPQHLVHSKAGWNPGNTKMVASSVRLSAFLFTSIPFHKSSRIWKQPFLKPREFYSLSDLGQANQSHRCGKELAEARDRQPRGPKLAHCAFANTVWLQHRHTHFYKSSYILWIAAFVP